MGAAAITGPAGSGKSTLVHDVLYAALAQRLMRAKTTPGPYEALEGVEHLDKVIEIDQSPIGSPPRSNPATHTGVVDEIRDLFAKTPEARKRGYGPGRFSFNVKGGRCEACGGDGTVKIEMLFLPDLYVPCEVCKGKRYNKETLEVKLRGKSIADVLDMTVEEALDFFQNVPSIARKLQLMVDVGLGYMKLGQPSPTLSGGEAQVRVVGRGRGGRNLEFLLALYAHLKTPLYALAADSDGLDGNSGAAGALLTPAVWEKGLDPRPFLEENDSLGFFQEAGTLLKTGPTGTNLNDFRLLLVD